MTATTTIAMPRAAAVDVIREPIALREWLGHMTLFHTNVQILNDSARTIYILMRVESHADASSAHTVPPHALEPGYSHLYSIPREEPLARFTIALGEPGDDSGGGAIHFIALCSNLRLLSGERLRVIECC
jgi:hypothetical protein